MASSCNTRRRLPLATAVLALLPLIAATRVSSSPPVIDVSVAPLYTGEAVTVEATVRTGRREGNVIRLQLGEPPASLDLVLLEGLLRRFPADAEQRFVGKTIRASGTIREFRGRWEMVVREPQNVAVVGLPANTNLAPPPQSAVQASPGVTVDTSDRVHLHTLDARLRALEAKVESRPDNPPAVGARADCEERLRKMEIRLRHLEQKIEGRK